MRWSFFESVFVTEAKVRFEGDRGQLNLFPVDMEFGKAKKMSIKSRSKKAWTQARRRKEGDTKNTSTSEVKSLRPVELANS